MRRVLILLLLLVAAFASAQDATVSFVDGIVDIRTESGAEFPATFGSELDLGDRVITERGSFAELELTSGGVVEVDSDTVFILGTGEDASGQPQRRVAAAIGSFAFRFNAAVGDEPQIGSTTSAGGVRGTEVRVYAASDGTTRYEVIEGLLEVEENGRMVSLGPNDAVEVRAGQAPSSVFSFLEQPIDYGAWNASLVDDFLADPLATLNGIAAEMYALIDEIERRVPVYEELRENAEALGEETSTIEDENDRDAFFNEIVLPAREAARQEFIALRYVVLSALSLDQYVLSRLASEIEAVYFFQPEDELYVSFKTVLEEIRSVFQGTVVPWLVPSDV